ncbi:Lrp/AsnC family transcriptional regulator [bacterium]|nr:Lrp/AsnC family transcriptional regulator [bacterium]MBU1957607.1 Lrp/AsnC family transcriptional regulator [bacterium]
MKSELLSIIQKRFPLTPRPFAVIAQELGSDEETIIKLLSEEKSNKIIRQISPIFDTKRLGYSSSLISFKVRRENIDRAVEVINAHPGVSHNYEREHPFNIWFTLAVAPDSKLGLRQTVEILANEAQAIDYIMLPTLKLFKIAVKLNTTGEDAKKEVVIKPNRKLIVLTPLYYRVIALVQNDIPLVAEPFKEVVDQLGLSYEEFFAILNELKEAGVMRRFAAILNHRKAGFNANAMVVWDIDESKGEAMGEIAAQFSAVSHCYLRPKYDNWPYNLFTMVHGKTTEETNGIIKEMANEIEHFARRPLYSTREFKKVRIRYFTPEFQAWEDNVALSTLS